MEPLYQLAAIEAARRLHAGSLTSESLVRSCLERIEEREERVQAWEYIDAEHALEQARRCDRSPRRGLLHGLPIGVKDVIDTADMPSLWGNAKAYANRRPDRDAPVVQRLREEGAVILGKTAPSRFSFWWPGKTRNPRNLDHTPGSSSSGSAAAVADYMCPVAIGTQTGGSIMRPAAFCGVVGFKPTHDWMPWRHSRDFAPTFDVVGGMARSVGDIVLLMRALTGKTDFDPDARLDGAVSIGLCRTADWWKAPAYVHRAYEETADYMNRQGCSVRDVELPKIYDELSEAMEIVQAYESARSFEWDLRCRRDTLEAGLIELLESGWAIPRERYLSAIALGEECRKRFSGDIGDVDVVMVPGSSMEAPNISEVGNNQFIRMWMPLYVPDVALPVTEGPNGLPMGVQLIGRQGDDARHLIRARRLEDLLKRRA